MKIQPIVSSQTLTGRSVRFRKDGETPHALSKILGEHAQKIRHARIARRFGQNFIEKRSVLVLILGLHLGDRFDRFEGRALIPFESVENLVHLRHACLAVLFDNGGDDRLFGRKMPVELPHADARLTGQLSYGCGMKAFTSEKPAGSRKYALARRFPFGMLF